MDDLEYYINKAEEGKPYTGEYSASAGAVSDGKREDSDSPFLLRHSYNVDNDLESPFLLHEDKLSIDEEQDN